MPELAVTLLGEEQNQSRVFISLKGDSFAETLSTNALRITTAGTEGSLTFFPSPTLGKLKLKQDSQAVTTG